MRSSCSWMPQLTPWAADRVEESRGQEGTAVAQQKGVTESESSFSTLATNILHFSNCDRDCHSRIGLYSHSRHSSATLLCSKLTFLAQSIVLGKGTTSGIFHQYCLQIVHYILKKFLKMGNYVMPFQWFFNFLSIFFTNWLDYHSFLVMHHFFKESEQWTTIARTWVQVLLKPGFFQFLCHCLKQGFQ